ncbi:unnamed protein product [Tenebrio molitor]|nr:unnamed protein product [Tenebrio molitor]
MNFEDNTLTVELSNPEIRYEIDYEAKGKMMVLVLPFDSTGLVTVISIPNFRKCDQKKSNFNECLSDAIWNAITQLEKPMEKYGLPTLEPFLIKSLDAKSHEF